MSLQNVCGLCMSQHMSQHKGEENMISALIADERLCYLWMHAQIKELLF